MMMILFMALSSAVSGDGIYLRGMKSGTTLQTVYDDSLKQHILQVVEGYIDSPIYAYFMHLEGDSTVIDAIGDYSDAGLGKQAFIVKPPPGVVYYIARMIVSYKDDGDFDSGYYGNRVALLNGLDFWYRINGVNVLPSFRPPFYIKTNTDWAAICYDSRVDTYGQGENQLTARFSFSRFGKYIRLDGDVGEEFVVYVHDDFTGLNAHKFLLQGFLQVK